MGKLFWGAALLVAGCANSGGSAATVGDAAQELSADTATATDAGAVGDTAAAVDAAADVASEVGADTAKAEAVTADGAAETTLDVAVDTVAAKDTVATDVMPIDTAAADSAVEPDTAPIPGVGEMCTNNGKACNAGLQCYMPPSKGGPMPVGTCVPVLQPGDCYDNSLCGTGHCFGAVLYQGKPGFCLPDADAGKCWPGLTSMCYPDSTCVGAFVCPPKASCPKMSSPGTCTAGPSSDGKVFLWVPAGSLMIPGSKTHPTWVNYSKDTIFLPGCTTWNTEQQDAKGQWIDKGPPAACVWEGVAKEVPSGGYAADMEWIAPTAGSTIGMANYRFSGSYSLGCTAGQPISTGKCSSTIGVKSSAVFVGYPP